MIEEKLRAKECEEAGKAKEMNLPEPQEGTVPADPWILAQRLILDFWSAKCKINFVLF